jgi:tetratricopeptide (TPR) repeat protein
VTLFEGRTSGEARLQEIVDACRHRLRDDPGDTAAVLRLADALAASGDPREAVGVLNRAGPRLQKAGKLLEAIAVYKKVMELDPKAEVTSSFLAHIELKKILEEAGKSAAQAAPAASEAGQPPSAGVAERRRKSEKVHALRREIPLLKDIPPFLLALVLEDQRTLARARRSSPKATREAPSPSSPPASSSSRRRATAASRSSSASSARVTSPARSPFSAAYRAPPPWPREHAPTSSSSTATPSPRS